MKKSAKARENNIKTHNTAIPPVIIFSITGNCNLRCGGCYADKFEKKNILDLSEVRNLLEQAGKLGVFYFFIAGGEPLLRKDVLELLSEFREMVFLVFTNSLLIDDEIVSLFRKNYNIIPVISFEGAENYTDARRGPGVFKEIMEKVKLLNENRVLTGFSVMMDNNSKEYISSRQFLGYAKSRFNFGIVTAYQSLNNAPAENALINLQEYSGLCDRITILAEENNFLIFNFPGDEEKLGGCISAGIGFVHVNADGDVEPCPFANVRAGNIRKQSLLEILKSSYLRTIREHREQFRKLEKGSCLLANNLDILEKIRKEV